MRRTYAIDFETYYNSKYSLKEMSVNEYVNDDRFNAYLVSVFGDDVQWVGNPKDFDWKRIDGQIWLMHNASFDQAVIDRLIELGIIPNVKAGELHDTADLTAYRGCKRSLKDAANILLGIEVDKGVRARMSGKIETTPEVLEYALKDAQTTYNLWIQEAGRWPIAERSVSRISRDAGFKGIRINQELLTSNIALLESKQHEAGLLIPWDWSTNDTPLSRAPFYEQCRIEGLQDVPASLSMTDEASQAWFEEYSERYPWIKARRDWNRINMLLSKLYTLRGMLKDGNAKFSTKYFGAGTGRWSGDGKFNMQNLPREELFGVNLRKLLIPDEGCKLLSVDLAQIEARVLLWAVQDEGMLRLIRSGHNLYEAHAESSMGWKDTGLKKKNPRLYALAKARVLGAGYGAGPTTFKRIAKMLAGLDLTNEECVNTIQSFRASNPKVVQFWYTLSRKILEKTYARNGACSIRLPSGRSLVYHELGLEGKDPMGTLVRGTPRKKLFGGLLTENYVQAVARDLLADYWVRMVEAGLDIRFTVHDEFVINSSNENRDLQIAQEIVHNPPLWLEGCPIGCEAVFSDYYVK